MKKGIILKIWREKRTVAMKIEKKTQKTQAQMTNYKKILVNVKPNNICGCSIKNGIYPQSLLVAKRLKL